MSKEETSFLPAYLVVGEDQLKSETVLKKLRDRLEQQGNLDFNAQTYECTRELVSRELLDALNTPPLGAPFRLVVIKDVDKAHKDLSEGLIDYLKNPLATTVLALTATKITAQSRLYKAVQAGGSKAIISASARKRNEIPVFVKDLASSYGLSLEGNVAARIIELVGSSTVALNTEIKKLASYMASQKRSKVSIKDLDFVIARSSEPTIWNFVDAFTEKDLCKCLELLRLITSESPIRLLYQCVSKLREIIQYKALSARGGVNLEKALGKADWQVKQLAKAAARFEAEEARDLLELAARLDARMKSGEDPRWALEEFLIASCS